MIILDTNVLSEMMKSRPSGEVLAWLNSQRTPDLFTTVVTEAEVFDGIERLPAGKRQAGLRREAEAVFANDFSGRVLPFEQRDARGYAEIRAGRSAIGRPISVQDAMIAAICRGQDAQLATRNTSDFEDCGIVLIDPWNP